MSTSLRLQSARPSWASARSRIQSPVARYGAYCALVALAFLFGGGARGDIQSLVWLRPAAILLGGFALIATPTPAGPLGTPFRLLIAFSIVIIAQLIPLPHGVWTGLPGRDFVAANDRLIGLGDLWRPITLSPNRTINSLFALSLPFAAFLLVRAQGPMWPKRLLLPILGFGALSAVLGLLQILGPSGSPLYFYRITNADAAVGLFSNRNHHAIFLASLLPLIAYVALTTQARASGRLVVLAACLGGAIFSVPLILATGSRAGALLAILALVSTGILWAARAVLADRAKGRGLGRRKRALVVGGAVALIGALGLAYVASRSLAFERLFTEQLDSELRVRLFPQLWRMVWDYFPVGTGYGTFELAYKVSEPMEFLDLQYLNQAHNDLLQFLIEGGVAGAALLLVFGLWFVLRGWRAGARFISQSKARGSIGVAPFAWISLAILLLGSLGDYPLRTPSIMLYAAVLCTLLARAVPPSAATRDVGRDSSRRGDSSVA